MEVYQKSLKFNYQIFNATKEWPKIYQYSLADQLRKAVLSISLNLSEGSSRTKKEFKRFISIARGSVYECIPLVEHAYRRKLITRKRKYLWYNQLVIIAKMLSKLRSSL
ncbi:MAG: four helix bundle protein [Candidatus Hodarchaeales archaeon]